MSLIKYLKKRKLKKSGEPKPKLKKFFKKDVRFSTEANKKSRPSKLRGESAREIKGFSRIYTIQKHNASHLHWDLRLEMNGVLKSWAIPKQPPRIKGLKRLAIQVEDHPISYANFEGTIPEGNYGAGKVEIWDKGTYELTGKKKDLIEVKIKGKKLTGEYCLVRTKFQGKKNNWIFFKK